MLLRILFIFIFLFSLSSGVLSRLIDLPQNTLHFLRQQHLQYQLTPTFEKKLKKNFLHHYYFPWRDPLQCLPALDLKYQEETVIAAYKENPGWNENKKRHTKQWILDMEKNMRLAQLPNKKARAILINPSHLRELPTEIPSFGNPKQAGEGYPFDNLQVSYLEANLPVYVIHVTRDGAWDFVMTPSDTIGWVRSENVAYVSQRFVQRWQRKKYDFVTPKIGHRPVKNKKGQYYFLTRLGSIYPLVKRQGKYDEILVATRDQSDKAVIQVARVLRSVVRPWPLKANSRNIAQFANHFLGEPYGWGGLYTYRDCSATIHDLFSPFGIWLPRHSTTQASTGIQISLANKTLTEKQQFILKHGIPFFTLLWLPGHILLYIGGSEHHVIALHSPWGIHTRNKQHQPGRIVIGRTVITPLDLGKNNPKIPKTWLDKTRSITYLVPLKALRPIKS